MKRTILSLLVVALSAGFGVSAIAAEDVKSGSEPKEYSRAIAPTGTESTVQEAAKDDSRTQPAKEECGMRAKDSAGNASDQSKDPK